MAAPTNGRVLIAGENGTGKELVARQIHDMSHRRAAAFIEVNCAAIPEELIESELFGHARGAFTGAVADRRGKFEMASGGTLFLDEVGDMSLKTQAKVLRALQEQVVEPVGGQASVRVDVRVIAATNKDLVDGIRGGRFREDLYFRLNVIPISVPPLRERGDDVLLLAEHYLQHFADQMARNVIGVGPDAARALMAYDWPGNVRELRNVMEYAAILCTEGEVGVRHLNLPTVRATNGHRGNGACPADLVRSLPDRRLETLERHVIEAALDENRGNIAKTARDLGIHRQTLYNKLKAYGLRSR
jgi:two-component system nitrogen regulation response regulator NtrX